MTVPAVWVPAGPILQDPAQAAPTCPGATALPSQPSVQPNAEPGDPARGRAAELRCAVGAALTAVAAQSHIPLAGVSNSDFSDGQHICRQRFTGQVRIVSMKGNAFKFTTYFFC